LRSQGSTLLLTTHQLEEAEQRCDRVAIVDHGRLVASGTVRELLAAHGGAERIVRIACDRSPRSMPQGATMEDGHLLARVHDVAEGLTSILAALRSDGVRVEDVAVERRGLQDVFLNLTGKELRE
jgi:ABC-2 type transport system ATP-binding protein